MTKEQTSRPWARVKEALAVMRQFLTTQTLSYQGEYFSYEDLATSVAPVQDPPPLKMADRGRPEGDGNGG